MDVPANNVSTKVLFYHLQIKLVLCLKFLFSSRSCSLGRQEGWKEKFGISAEPVRKDFPSNRRKFLFFFTQIFCGKTDIFPSKYQWNTYPLKCILEKGAVTKGNLFSEGEITLFWIKALYLKLSSESTKNCRNFRMLKPFISQKFTTH